MLQSLRCAAGALRETSAACQLVRPAVAAAQRPYHKNVSRALVHVEHACRHEHLYLETDRGPGPFSFYRWLTTMRTPEMLVLLARTRQTLGQAWLGHQLVVMS